MPIRNRDDAVEVEDSIRRIFSASGQVTGCRYQGFVRRGTRLRPSVRVC